ncbi:unnamed protein product [Malus baccata var. baccata]
MWVFVSNFSPLKLKLIAKLSNAYFRLFDSNMLISNITTVICLDDYHSLDRTRRRKKEVMTLDPRANDFELMLDPIVVFLQYSILSFFLTLFNLKVRNKIVKVVSQLK